MTSSPIQSLPLICALWFICIMTIVAANSYIAVLGPPRYAAFRLTAAQASNGVATVVGPLIASGTFFKAGNESKDTLIECEQRLGVQSPCTC